MADGMEPLRPALFIDRDGTLIADAHYLSDPAGVRLLPDTGTAVQLARTADVPLVIVTNQSGIARGLITAAQYEATRARTEALIHAAGGVVLATYHCPHFVDVTGPCACRKPGLGMYQQAAREYPLDLARSAYIGDRWRDVQPALATGGVGILVPGRETPAADQARAEEAGEQHAHIAVARTLTEAVTLAITRLGMGVPT
ncbi:HAD family hydrolase [Gemmatimonas sp.]|uniref:D-glycero-alpha-D-manno-heptose-1,7-bisphosphate 7-phosphatase n=1 Tax=Gemmatimonas sp. TaxID=1962908 RepID=UPI0025BD5426|nr:HAD family hydrolase [Gemmatimonas sp.]MCA2991726.1 HAD family hydrolase [Gemmatimonas sp.]